MTVPPFRRGEGVTDPVSVAVLVTAWKRDKYVVGAVRSALAQTSPPDEVVVVKTHGEADDEVKAAGATVLFMSPETTFGAQHLMGLDASRSDVIAFLDDDDRFLPTKVEDIRRAFERDGALDLYRNELTPVFDSDVFRDMWDYRWVTTTTRVDPFARDAQARWRRVAACSLGNLSTYSVRRYVFERARSVLPLLNGAPEPFYTMAGLQCGPALFSTDVGTRHFVHHSASHGPKGEAVRNGFERRSTSLNAILPHIDGTPLSRRLARDYLVTMEIDAAHALGLTPTASEWWRLMKAVMRHPSAHRLLFTAKAIGHAMGDASRR